MPLTRRVIPYATHVPPQLAPSPDVRHPWGDSFAAPRVPVTFALPSRSDPSPLRAAMNCRHSPFPSDAFRMSLPPPPPSLPGSRSSAPEALPERSAVSRRSSWLICRARLLLMAGAAGSRYRCRGCGSSKGGARMGGEDDERPQTCALTSAPHLCDVVVGADDVIAPESQALGGPPAVLRGVVVVMRAPARVSVTVARVMPVAAMLVAGVAGGMAVAGVPVAAVAMTGVPVGMVMAGAPMVSVVRAGVVRVVRVGPRREVTVTLVRTRVSPLRAWVVVGVVRVPRVSVVAGLLGLGTAWPSPHHVSVGGPGLGGASA